MATPLVVPPNRLGPARESCFPFPVKTLALKGQSDYFAGFSTVPASRGMALIALMSRTLFWRGMAPFQ